MITSTDPIAFSSLDAMQGRGFVGFQSVSSLWHDSSCIPRTIGVYAVLNLDYLRPHFITPGVGGLFKGKDPNVSVEVLREQWISNSPVIYIGKAGTQGGDATLRSRLRQYLDFGRGKPAHHWGGRYIWQLANHADLLFCWQPTPVADPRSIEKELLAAFKEQFGRLPFANLTS